MIGSYEAQELYAGTNPVGQTLKLNGAAYKIVGVLEETADSTESSDDDIVYVPYTSATRLAEARPSAPITLLR